MKHPVLPNSANEVVVRPGTPELLILLRTLWAGKVVVAVFVAVAVAMAAVYIHLSVPRYTATVLLSLEDFNKKLVNLGGGVESGPDPSAIETEVNVLRSNGLVRRLVEKEGLLADPEFNSSAEPEPSVIATFLDRVGISTAEPNVEVGASKSALSATVAKVRKAISIESVPSTVLIEVHAESRSPEKAARLANSLAELHIASRLESRFDAAGHATDWLGTKVADLKKNLEDAENELESFRASTEIVSPESLETKQHQVKELRKRLLETEQEANIAARQVAALEGLGESSVEALREKPVLAPLLAGRFTSQVSLGSDELSALRLRQGATEKRKRRAVETLVKSINELDAQIQRQSEELVTLEQLEREVEASAAIYSFALGRLKELSVERGVQQAGTKILSEAQVPLGPSTPGNSVVLALAVAIGTIFGGGLVLARQRLQDTFRAAEDIETLTGLPVIGQVPSFPGRGREAAMKEIEGRAPSIFSESVRSLRTSILALDGANSKTIVLASALPGEGKTTLALALARTLSLIGRKVLVVDADLRRRSLGRYFRIDEEKPGLATAMLDRLSVSEVVTRSESLGIDLLLGEKSGYNAADLFSFQEFSSLIQDAKKDYDHIIIDTPPALAVPDVRLIAKCASFVLLVVRWDHTSRLQLLDAVRELEDGSNVISGCILSQVDPKGVSRYGYGDRRGTLAAFRAGYFE